MDISDIWFKGLMNTNDTWFSGSNSTSDYSDEATPLFITYLQAFMLLLVAPLVAVPVVMIIRVIAKNGVLQTRNNIFLVNLLVADLCILMLRWLVNGTLIILYLLGFEIDVNCNIVLVPTIGLLMATKLMFVPLSVDRFIHVAFPFSYKRIMSTRVIATIISSLWLLALFVSLVTLVDRRTDYFPSVGSCKPRDPNPLLHVFFLGPMTLSFVIITITSIYLRYRIIKSNRFFHSVKRSAAEERKSIKAGKLVEILQEQIKPTLSVFIAGGLDGMLNMSFVITFGIASTVATSTTFLYVIQFMLLPIQFCQSLSHTLTYGFYNKKIRKKLFISNYCSKKQSKVVALNRQRQ